MEVKRKKAEPKVKDEGDSGQKKSEKFTGVFRESAKRTPIKNNNCLRFPEMDVKRNKVELKVKDEGDSE